MNLVEAITERLSIFKKLYDIVRIIDPVNKESIIVKEGGIE
jgi:two-component system, cell cycle response regulator